MFTTWDWTHCTLKRLEPVVQSCKLILLASADDEADQEIPGSGEQHRRWPETHPHLRTLTPSERAVSDLLWALFAAPAALKLGFAFHNDLHQLVNSFPHLPVFESLPVRLRTPRRVHAPALHRARQESSLGNASTPPDSEAPCVATKDSDVADVADRRSSVSASGYNGSTPAASTQNTASTQPSCQETVAQRDEQARDELLGESESEGETGGGLSLSEITNSENSLLNREMQAEQAVSAAAMSQGGSDNVAEIVESGEMRASSGVVQEKDTVADIDSSEVLGSFLLNSFVDISALEALCRGRSRQHGVRESLSATTKRYDYFWLCEFESIPRDPVFAAPYSLHHRLQMISTTTNKLATCIV